MLWWTEPKILWFSDVKIDCASWLALSGGQSSPQTWGKTPAIAKSWSDEWPVIKHRVRNVHTFPADSDASDRKTSRNFPTFCPVGLSKALADLDWAIWRLTASIHCVERLRLISCAEKLWLQDKHKPIQNNLRMYRIYIHHAHVYIREYYIHLWYIDWLIDWLIDWSIDWSIDWLIDWLIGGWLVGWLVGW